MHDAMDTIVPVAVFVVVPIIAVHFGRKAGAQMEGGFGELPVHAVLGWTVACGGTARVLGDKMTAKRISEG